MNVKRFLILLGALLLTLGALAACDGAEESQKTPYSFAVGSAIVEIDGEAEAILQEIGPWSTYDESPSCAFEGLDKTYYFGSFYLQTYPQGDKDYVFGFWFADDSVSTNENIYIGAPQAQVEAAYGADSYNGTNAYILTKGETKLTVILTDGVVSSIQYDALFD